MLTYNDLRRGILFIMDKEPYLVLEFSQMKKAQRRVVIQTKIKNLINGNVFEKNFHQGDVFEEANLEKLKAKFIYSHKDRFFFCEADDPSKRFDLSSEQVGSTLNFLKQNQIVEALIFEGKIISISLPVKIQLKVKEAPPGMKGDRAQSGTKTVVLENGSNINVPLFVNQDDIIEINTETGEYVRRVE